MKNTIVLGIIQNFAILLTFSILYDHFYGSRVARSGLRVKLSSGIVLGFITILVIMTPWDYIDGVFFDTRTVLLSIGGLFFGFVPTLVAVILSSAYRIYLGGDGLWMGLSTIISSGGVGLLWARYFPISTSRRPLLNLLLLGLCVHILMLASSILLPAGIRSQTLHTIFFPVVFLYPLATMFSGWYMWRQMKLRAARRALYDSEKRWQFALEGTGDGLWDWNLKTDEVFFSQQWKSMLGFEQHEISNLLSEWERLVHPDDLEAAYKSINLHIQGEVPTYVAEYRMFCKDGTIKWILDSGKVMEFDKDGNPLRFLGTHKDISYRKEKEMQLSQERFLLDSLMSLVPEPIYFKDAQSRFIRVNQAAVEHYGCRSMEEVIGKTDFDFFSEDDAAVRFSTEQQIMETGVAYHKEEMVIRSDDSRHWGITNKLPFRDQEGKIAGTFGITVDITRLKKIELALTESERYTKSILESIPDLLFIVSADKEFLEFKTGNKRELFVPVDIFLNKKISEVFPRHLATLFDEGIDQALATGKKVQLDYELEIDGKNNFFECYIISFVPDKVIVMARNITRRKLVERELKHSQTELKQYAGHLQKVREEERVLLAREIHDELGQMLIAMKIDVGMFRQEFMRIASPREQHSLTEQFERIIDLLDTTIKTTRRIMTGLRPAMLELVGFQGAAVQYMAEFEERYHINYKLHIEKNIPEMEEQRSIALFRILQEALTNIVKHAKATSVDVDIRLVDEKLVLQIADDGKGLDVDAPLRKDAYGLVGMKERVFLLDGKLTFLPNPGGGTLVLVEVPLTDGTQANVSPPLN